jgi:hypothetical protein
MNVIRSLWASIQGSPVFMRRVNGWLTILWIVMIPISLITGWISSVTYVAALSLWALVSGHWSAWQAARVEVRQEEEARRAEQKPVEQRVVDKLVNETTINPLAGQPSSTQKLQQQQHSARDSVRAFAER